MSDSTAVPAAHPHDTTGDHTMTMTDTEFETVDAAPVVLYRLSGVTRTYRQKDRIVKALAGVDLDIAQGDFVTIQGPTGGGKSTLLQLLGALDRPTDGTVVLGDVDLAKATNVELGKVRAREIGFVFQGFNLIPTLTAAENVEMALEPLGLSKEERAQRVAEALVHVGLDDRADHRPAELSGGQQQRVAIARAIVKRPRVLLADEPTGNLDTERSFEIMELLTDLNRSGITVLMVTHEPDMAAFARTIVHFRDGLVERIENTGKAGV